VTSVSFVSLHCPRRATIAVAPGVALSHIPRRSMCRRCHGDAQLERPLVHEPDDAPGKLSIPNLVLGLGFLPNLRIYDSCQFCRLSLVLLQFFTN
jgi:hypothetical protein